MEVLNFCFATSNSRVCPKASYNVFTLPRHSSCLLLCPLMLLPVVLSFLRCNCWIAPWSRVPLLHSSCAQCLFLNIRPFEVPLATLSLVQFSIISFRLSVLYDCVPYAMPFLHAGSSVCRQWPTSSRTHHCPGSVSSAVHGALQVRCQSPYCSFSAPKVSTAAFSLGTS
jgi:hypothetical protein